MSQRFFAARARIELDLLLGGEVLGGVVDDRAHDAGDVVVGHRRGGRVGDGEGVDLDAVFGRQRRELAE